MKKSAGVGGEADLRLRRNVQKQRTVLRFGSSRKGMSPIELNRNCPVVREVAEGITRPWNMRSSSI
jgi:hypothetical protein